VPAQPIPTTTGTTDEETIFQVTVNAPFDLIYLNPAEDRARSEIARERRLLWSRHVPNYSAIQGSTSQSSSPSGEPCQSQYALADGVIPSLVVAALLVGAIVASAFGAESGQQQEGAPAKTVVLVHGAFADGSSWNKVIPLLQAEGLKVVGRAKPLTSLATTWRSPVAP